MWIENENTQNYQPNDKFKNNNPTRNVYRQRGMFQIDCEIRMKFFSLPAMSQKLKKTVLIKEVHVFQSNSMATLIAINEILLRFEEPLVARYLTTAQSKTESIQNSLLRGCNRYRIFCSILNLNFSFRESFKDFAQNYVKEKKVEIYMLYFMSLLVRIRFRIYWFY